MPHRPSHISCPQSRTIIGIVAHTIGIMYVCQYSRTWMHMYRIPSSKKKNRPHGTCFSFAAIRIWGFIRRNWSHKVRRRYHRQSYRNGRKKRIGSVRRTAAWAAIIPSRQSELEMKKLQTLNKRNHILCVCCMQVSIDKAHSIRSYMRYDVELCLLIYVHLLQYRCWWYLIWM